MANTGQQVELLVSAVFFSDLCVKGVQTGSNAIPERMPAVFIIYAASADNPL